MGHSRPCLDLQQAQGLLARPGVSFSIYKSTRGQVGGALSPGKAYSPHLKFLMQGSLVLPPKGPGGLPFLGLPLSFICGHCGWTGRATRSKGIPQGINENSNPNSSGGISCNWQGLMRSKISFGISLVQPLCSREGWVRGTGLNARSDTVTGSLHFLLSPKWPRKSSEVKVWGERSPPSG